MLSIKKLIYKMMEEFPTKVITTDTFSSLPYTYSNTKIKAHHVVVDSQLSNPSAQTSDWTVTTANGSMTISGSISGATTLTVKLTKGE
jgi:hypothetical protein